MDRRRFSEMRVKILPVIVHNIVRIGEPPGNQPSDSEEATCYAWSLRYDEDQTEVIAADSVTGEVKCRYSAEEAENLVNRFRAPKIR